MERSSVRLIPFIFDKLFCHIAPADAIVCRNACQVFDPVAFRQVRYRLSTPKKGMLLLAWPFCMHAGENASNPYKQVEFYDILRVNVMRIAAGFRLHSDIVDEKMRKFLSGLELFMLHCVLSSIKLYTDLNVLMLDFHAENLVARATVVCSHNDELYHGDGSRWFLTKSLVQLKLAAAKKNELVLFIDTELWSKVINAVVAQCASTLRHFVFCSSLWLPEQFYTSLKLDRMLVKLQQLETLYMPSFEKCEQAYTNAGIQGSCWQALIDLPREKRLPSLRRVVAEHTLDSEKRLVFTDAGNNVGTRFVELLNSTTLPQFHYLSPKLAVEVVLPPSMDDYRYPDMEARVRQLAGREVLPNYAWYARKTNSLMLSHRTLERQMYEHVGNIRNSFPEFIDAVETALLKVVQRRPQMLSVVNDVNTNRGQKATIPACMNAYALPSSEPEKAALTLNALSRGLSWPLSLTLEFAWIDLLKHLSLFIVTTSTADKQDNNAASHWTKCFPRGNLKLRLRIQESLRQYVAYDFRQEDKMFSNLSADNRYRFPLHVTVEVHPPLLQMMHGHNDGMPAIREYFTKCMREFVNDVTGENPKFDYCNKFNDPDTLAAIYARSKNLRADLYASCRKLVISLRVCYGFMRPAGGSDVPADVINENIRRVEQLLYDKQLEQELLCGLYAKHSVEDEEEEEKKQQMFILPNLKSISFVRTRSVALLY